MGANLRTFPQGVQEINYSPERDTWETVCIWPQSRSVSCLVFPFTLSRTLMCFPPVWLSAPVSQGLLYLPVYNLFHILCASSSCSPETTFKPFPCETFSVFVQLVPSRPCFSARHIMYLCLCWLTNLGLFKGLLLSPLLSPCYVSHCRCICLLNNLKIIFQHIWTC